jgi:hypothetical protein
MLVWHIIIDLQTSNFCLNSVVGKVFLRHNQQKITCKLPNRDFLKFHVMSSKFYKKNKLTLVVDKSVMFSIFVNLS